MIAVMVKPNLLSLTGNFKSSAIKSLIGSKYLGSILWIKILIAASQSEDS